MAKGTLRRIRCKGTCPVSYVVGKKLAKLVCLHAGDTKLYKQKE